METLSFIIGSVGLVAATVGIAVARSCGGRRRAAGVTLALPSAVVLLGLLGACNDAGGTAGAVAPVAVMTAVPTPTLTASATPISTPAVGAGDAASVPPAAATPAFSPAAAAAPPAAGSRAVTATRRPAAAPSAVRTVVPAAAVPPAPAPARTTAAVVVAPVPVRTSVPPAAPAPVRTTAPAVSGRCDPSYPDVCLRTGIGDYDCAGGSGNGPNYVQGPVRVLRPDPFGLDADGDGTGCQS
ncbi:hypothetical protein [Frankia gtarii]|uniref:hypothetical protein n=1 Tax=Frankia gtarii TaxID=2950102 RepID=UPI0021C12F6C|nr:hypothetical protein [Frankia gtarii]